MAVNSVTTLTSQAGLAFDHAAKSYDHVFTSSLIGRTQRNAVWRVVKRTFHAGDTVLELNCGTGEDALFLSNLGVTVLACDASAEMVDVASRRLQTQRLDAPVEFLQLPTERIGELQKNAFDGAFSNFSGLNCVEDLRGTAETLSHLVREDGQLLFCFSTRFCFAEILYYLSTGLWRKAFRRCSGRTIATLGQQSFPVYYPTLRQIKMAFLPYFKLRSCVGVGVMVPPSYLEPWAQNHPRIFALLRKMENEVASLPIIRTFGDHILLRFERVPNARA